MWGLDEGKVSASICACDPGMGGKGCFSAPGAIVGNSTPNSLDDEDFTDGRDESSQFSTSEQSETEDIRNFESYVEEFNRKKQKQEEEQDSSPLRCPFPPAPRTVAPPITCHPLTIPPIPPASTASPSPAHPQPNPASLSAFGDDDYSDFKSASPLPSVGVGGGGFSAFRAPGLHREARPFTQTLMASSHHVTKDDFSDFQEAPAPKKAPLENNLLGEEDKYGALRSLTLEADVENPTTPAGPLPSAVAEEEDEDWADFSSAPPAPEQTDAGPGNDKGSILNLYSVTPQPTPQPAPTALMEDSQDWADFTSAPAEFSASAALPGQGMGVPSANFPSFSKASDSVSVELSAPGQGEEGGESGGWVSVATSQGKEAKSAQATGSSAVLGSQSGAGDGDADSVVTVKKSNLVAGEILGLFKVREDTDTLQSYRLPQVSQQLFFFMALTRFCSDEGFAS